MVGTKARLTRSSMPKQQSVQVDPRLTYLCVMESDIAALFMDTIFHHYILEDHHTLEDALPFMYNASDTFAKLYDFCHPKVIVKATRERYYQRLDEFEYHYMDFYQDIFNDCIDSEQEEVHEIFQPISSFSRPCFLDSHDMATKFSYKLYKDINALPWLNPIPFVSVQDIHTALNTASKLCDLGVLDKTTLYPEVMSFVREQSNNEELLKKCSKHPFITTGFTSLSALSELVVPIEDEGISHQYASPDTRAPSTIAEDESVNDEATMAPYNGQEHLLEQLDGYADGVHDTSNTGNNASLVTKRTIQSVADKTVAESHTDDESFNAYEEENRQLVSENEALRADNAGLKRKVQELLETMQTQETQCNNDKECLVDAKNQAESRASAYAVKLGKAKVFMHDL